MIEKIKKFNLDLTDKNVLTEAASGNYVVTPIIAALAGAKVIAVTKASKYGTIDEIKEQTYSLAKEFNIEKMIKIVEDKEEIDFKEFDIVTNTGFVRPINKKIIDKLSSNCVIPLMWEPWEFRKEDLDLDACSKKGIKVYGTNESDSRLQTMKYIGFCVLDFLLKNKMTPFSTKLLILGNKLFAQAIIDVVDKLNYEFTYINEKIDVSTYQAIIFAENEINTELLGVDGYILKRDITPNHYLVHICGNVDFNNLDCKVNTKFGYMSFTTDYIDNQAVIDLHTAGLKVAEGMLKANKLNLSKDKYKVFMESNYPALSFEDKKFW
ncbi:hypothetical protein PT520_08785 [Aliarcobacter butzleri]|uniref:Uncharacterized protein n=1 Tax=Aliarcobacter butzleri TaxID=28197 RepID=A0AAW6VQX0_9BACT|nr:hypothetical protein [Aliarcobacter butzleri]MDK2062613.1 hypothetical protein [Aliarcobacter butzleri]